MLNPREVNRLLSLIKADQSDAENLQHIKEALLMEKECADRTFVTEILWTTDDIESIRPEYSDQELQEAKVFCERVLHERSVQEGLEILDCLLDLFETKIPVMACNKSKVA
jgi:transcriptional regulator of heat shock response